ncbi:hypothetical protein E2C01_055173 [Portunus trituberculatus]|uniref:Uncharacterized protein n=1 Tax=Portunus trituberculatus TaxID=210409 RepID=A0A5B7GLM8_PORTR|nr:hypothetical protein [Portunus trituberculatus]
MPGKFGDWILQFCLSQFSKYLSQKELGRSSPRRPVAQHGTLLAQEAVGEAQHDGVLRLEGSRVASVLRHLGQVENPQHERDGGGLRVVHVVAPGCAAPEPAVLGAA